MDAKIHEIQTQFLVHLESVSSLEEMDRIKSDYLGKKSPLTHLYQTMGTLSPEEKRDKGSRINNLRVFIQDSLEKKREHLLRQQMVTQLQAEHLDLTLPLPVYRYQGRHPITQTMEYLMDVLISMGFDVGEGPEIDHEDYNFTFLNIPEYHPARASHDTFYIQKPWLLRTHTSPVQVHYMRQFKNLLPIHMIAPGRVYRADDDATHSPMFHQIEGLGIDRGIHFGTLKSVIKAFLKQVFDMEKVRFRPSFFPFTEPSTEVDMGCVFCQGKGCKICKHTGWLEVMGAGLVHGAVLKWGGISDKKMRGYAFGLGVERMTMLLFGIPDMRMLFDNDPRIFNQVARVKRFPMV
jgi:phenylalanyl-tRNA synthetase alpha chain